MGRPLSTLSTRRSLPNWVDCHTGLSGAFGKLPMPISTTVGSAVSWSFANIFSKSRCFVGKAALSYEPMPDAMPCAKAASWSALRGRSYCLSWSGAGAVIWASASAAFGIPRAVSEAALKRSRRDVGESQSPAALLATLRTPRVRGRERMWAKAATCVIHGASSTSNVFPAGITVYDDFCAYVRESKKCSLWWDASVRLQFCAVRWQGSGALGNESRNQF